jgi:hypothetical protein
MCRRRDGLAIGTIVFIALLTTAGASTGATAPGDQRRSPSIATDIADAGAPARRNATGAAQPLDRMTGVPEEAALVLVGTMLLGLAAAVRRTA